MEKEQESVVPNWFSRVGLEPAHQSVPRPFTLFPLVPFDRCQHVPKNPSTLPSYPRLFSSHSHCRAVPFRHGTDLLPSLLPARLNVPHRIPEQLLGNSPLPSSVPSGSSSLPDSTRSRPRRREKEHASSHTYAPFPYPSILGPISRYGERERERESEKVW